MQGSGDRRKQCQQRQVGGFAGVFSSRGSGLEVACQVYSSAWPKALLHAVSRRLIMMRHADSERPLLSQDHARPITEQGRQEARDVAEQLQAKGWLPQMVMCSSAVRTMQTLESMRDAVAALRRAEVHARGTLFTVAALDGVTLQHLQVLLNLICQDWTALCLVYASNLLGGPCPLVSTHICTRWPGTHPPIC